jgi:hypothetical protein
MKKQIAVPVLLGLFAIAHLVAWGEEGGVPLKITVTEAVVTSDGVLHCKWKIRNDGREVLHVYAPYLRGSSDGMIDALNTKTSIVRTTWLSEVPVYSMPYFPKLEFIDVVPGAEITGALERRPQSKQETAHLRELKIVVGYGTDTEKLNSDIQQLLNKAVEFQSNALVRWQKLVYSEPVNVSQ